MLDGQANENAHALHFNPNPRHMDPYLIKLAANPENPTENLMYPYDESDHLYNVNSMKQFHDQPLPFRLPFSGFAYNYIWVSTRD